MDGSFFDDGVGAGGGPGRLAVPSRIDHTNLLTNQRTAALCTAQPRPIDRTNHPTNAHPGQKSIKLTTHSLTH